MKNLDRWMAAYVAMDDEARSDNLMFAESAALAHPAKAPLALSLVAGGGGATTGSNKLDVSQGIPSLTLVQRVVSLK
jgi:hypothetical protein